MFKVERSSHEKVLRLEGEWYVVAGEGLWRWRALADEAGEPGMGETGRAASGAL